MNAVLVKLKTDSDYQSSVSMGLAVLCRARPLISGTGTTGEARETGASLIVGGGAAAQERG